MDLSNFPFDIQTIRAELVSISHWSQCDCARKGSLAQGQSYALRPVTRPGEGQLMWMMWDGHITEWLLHSWTIEKTTSKHVAGFVMSLLNVELHIHRQYRFYYSKVLLPLVMLTGGAFMVQLLPASALPERLELVFTMFLTAFALQYAACDPPTLARTRQRSPSAGPYNLTGT